MRICIHILSVLFAALIGVCEVAATDFRAQVLINTDENVNTGCATETNVAPAGSELRLIALTTRTHIVETRVESCQSGVWRVDVRDESTRPLSMGQGVSGSDALRWQASRQVLGDYSHLPLQVFLERLDVPAHDALDVSGEWLTLRLPLSESANAIPVFGFGMGALLVVGLATIGLYAARRADNGLTHLCLPAAAALLTAWVMISPPDARAEVETEEIVVAHDVANDVSDASVDILRVQASRLADHIAIQLDINNVESDGLPDQAKILFIGNSLTYSNDLPAMLEAIARQAGKQLDTDEITAPNYALEDHFRQRTAHGALATGGYAIVIMQQGPSSLPESQVHLRRWSKQFEPLIRAGGARPAMYMVWPDLSRISYFGDVRTSYSEAALATNGMFIPAGQAWLEAWATNVNLPLYGDDNFHPSELGTYVAALSIFAEIYRQTPVGLPTRLALADGHVFAMTPEVAQQVQSAAWATHLSAGRAGH